MTPVIILLLSVILLMFLLFVGSVSDQDAKFLSFVGLVVIIVCTSGICYQTQMSTPTQPSFQIHTIHGVEYAQINGAVYVRNNSLEIETIGVMVKEK